MDVSKLSNELQSQFRSDLVVQNISSCVIELVENALDANASCIAVRIDFEKFRLEVVDNGTGLNKDQLKYVGERYYTSKRKDITKVSNTSKHFGHRGEGLASIRKVSSRVLIISRAFKEDDTFCKIFEKSSTEVAESQYRRATVGTTVIIEDVLGKHPVRQRCIKPQVEFQTVKWFLMATALMFPMVTFSLRNDAKKSEIFHIKKTNSTALKFMELFPDAIKDRSSFLKIKIEHHDVVAKIMLSNEIYGSDQLQFVFVNKRYLPRCEVQKCFNNLLNKIDLPEKNVAQKAIYILNISCPRDDYDIVVESDRRSIEFRNWPKIKTSLITLVRKITNNQSFGVEETSEDKRCKQYTSEDAFHEMNTANTFFGLPANREKPTKHVAVYDIDDKSDPTGDLDVSKVESRISNSKRKKNLKSKLLGVSKKSHGIAKNKSSKSPRLADQGIAITYTKSPVRSKRVVEKVKSQNPTNAFDTDGEQDLLDFDESCSRVNKWNPESRINEKNIKIGKNTKEHYKNMVAMSYQQVLRAPMQNRISKKQNHYFDKTENYENCLIEKFGKIRKNPNVNSKEKSHVEKAKEPSKPDPQWTAKISHHEDFTYPTTMLFDKQSLELEGFNDTATICDENRKSTTLDHTLPPTLPWQNHDTPERPPLKEIHSCEKNDRATWESFLSKSNPNPVTLKCDNIANVEVVDPHHKVNEWISKLPPNGEVDSNDVINDYITPTKNSCADQIAKDFKTKTRISKDDEEDLPSPNRTPEKRKSNVENFEPKCKLKLNFDLEHIKEYKMKKKATREFKSKIPLFKWNCEPVRKSLDVSLEFDEASRTEEPQKNIASKIDADETNRDVQVVNFDAHPERMSWHDMKDSADTLTLDDPSKSNNPIQVASPLTSDCSSTCNCKCHKKSSCTNKSPSHPTRNIPCAEINQCGMSNSLKDTVILTAAPIQTIDRDVPVVLPETRVDIESNFPTQLVDFPDEMKQNTEELSSHLSNSDDSKKSTYFQPKIDLVEKLKYKLNSKFLESSCAVDIPRGMIELTKQPSKIEKLPEDEKKAVAELVKPYSMQDHITLDDQGNSCLRIFPFFTKNPEKSENLDVEDLNCSVVFAKEDIPSFKFIAQIENKFILAGAIVQRTQIPVLILLDQHAVDERIRVERLLKEYNENGEWSSTPVNPAIHLKISFSYSSLFTDYRSNLEEFGLFFEFNNRTKNNEEKLVVSFVKVPTCFYNRAMREKNNFQAVLKQLIESLTKEILKKIVNQGTLVHTIPNELQSVINYEACRGAVKFGDKLTPQVCSALLEGLARCNLPFQCAHGRPCLTPLVSFDKLAHLRKQVWEPSLEKLRKSLDKLKK